MKLPLVLFAVLLAGCAVPAEPVANAPLPPRIAAAVYGLKGQFMQNWVRQAKHHPEVASGAVTLAVLDGNYDALTQSNQIDTLLTQGYDGLVFVPIDARAGASAAARARAAQVPLIASNTMVSDTQVPYIGNDDVEGGRLQARALAKAIGGKGNVVILQGPIGQSAQIDRQRGEFEVLAAYPLITVIEMRTANWSRAEAMDLMEDWLNAHPGQINVVIAQNDDMALGALEAIKQRGLDPRRIHVTSIDGMPDAIRAAQRGELITFLQDAQGQAQGAIDLVLRRLRGPAYQPQSEIWQRYATQMPWNGGTDRRYVLPWVPVTAENAAALYAQVTGS
ncbi:MAG TPA: substrate-binding domain-containing protein [Stenotrophomonas sp.]|nr:substrate-binding domain-containing protein [Stenotrophomonas sp.]